MLHRRRVCSVELMEEFRFGPHRRISQCSMSGHLFVEGLTGLGEVILRLARYASRRPKSASLAVSRASNCLRAAVMTGAASNSVS